MIAVLINSAAGRPNALLLADHIARRARSYERAIDESRRTGTNFPSPADAAPPPPEPVASASTPDDIAAAVVSLVARRNSGPARPPLSESDALAEILAAASVTAGALFHESASYTGRNRLDRTVQALRDTGTTDPAVLAAYVIEAGRTAAATASRTPDKWLPIAGANGHLVGIGAGDTGSSRIERTAGRPGPAHGSCRASSNASAETDGSGPVLELTGSARTRPA